MKHVRDYTGWALMLLWPSSLLPMPARCGCMNNLLVLNTRSTGADWGDWNRKDFFSNSSCKSANSFFYVTRSQRVPWLLHRDLNFTRTVIVIITGLLCQCICRMHVLENFQQFEVRGRELVSWSSMTRTFLDDNTVSTDVAILPGTYCVTW